MKLVVMVVGREDAGPLVDELVAAGMPLTKVSGSGGFLGRGSTTIFSGVEDADVETVVATARRLTEARTELVPARQLPFLSDIGYDKEPREVRRGGAVIWVVPVEQFERV